MKLFIALLYLFLLGCLIPTAHASVWQREAPDSAGTYKGEYCSLAIDSEDNPHIAYFDEDFKDLRYAHYDNGIWTVDLVDSVGDAGRECSLALDSQNRPHISYQQEYLGDYWSLKYATLTDTGWAKTLVSTSYDTSIAEIGEYCSIAINNDDYPCISYTQKYPHKIMYAYQNANGWHFMDVKEVHQPYYTKIKLANGTNPIIGFHRLGTYNTNVLEVAYLNPADSSWNISTLRDTVKRIGYGHLIGFDIDSQGNAYYVYINADSDLQLAIYDGQNWSIETISVYPYFTGRPALSLKINHADQPCLATFQDEIYYYRKNNGEWKSTLVDDGVSPGWYCSLAFDNYDYPRIAAYAHTLEYTRDALFYYRYWPGDPQIVLSEVSHNFGNVWTQSYSDWDCPIENQGDAPLIINNLEYTSAWWDTAFHVSNTLLPKTILPQDSDFITIKFKPYADETYFDTLTIFSNDSMNLEEQIALQGTGTSSGASGYLQILAKNIYIDHQYQLLKNDLPLTDATTSLYQNSQLVYGPIQTGLGGEANFGDVALGNYDLKITKSVLIPGDEPETNLLDTLILSKSIEIGPGSNTQTILFPESLVVEKYQHIYNLTHIEKSSWNDSHTFSYPAEEDVKKLINLWGTNLPPDMQLSAGRLVLAEDMTYRMFDAGYSIGKEFMRDIGELLNLVLYSENWGTSIAEVLIDIIYGSLTSDWTALIADILMEVLQEFLQDMLINLITEGVHQISAELGNPGDVIVNTSWDIVVSGYSGWSLGGFSLPTWNKMAGRIYSELKDPIFQAVYIDLLTDDKIDKAKIYSQNFQYNGEFRDAYNNSNDFIANKLDDVEDAEDACEVLRISAELFSITSSVLDVLSILPIPGLDIILAISTAMQITAYVEVVTAMGLSGYTFFTLPGYIDDAVDDIYFPEGKTSVASRKLPYPFERAKIKPEVIASIKESLLHSTSDYDSVLSEIKSHVNSGDGGNAILALKDLMQAENNLHNNLRTTCAPIYSVTNIAKNSLESFSEMYDSLKSRYADAGGARYKNYLYVLFSPTDTSQAMKDTVNSQLDKSSNQTHVLANHIIATLDTVSVLPMPAILVASQSKQDAYKLEPGKTAAIQVQIQNVGALTAENVNIILKANPAIRIEETDSIYIGTLSPGEKSDLITWTAGLFDSSYTRGIWTANIQSSNAKIYSSGGSFRIIQNQTPGTGGKLNNENIYNYPNPFNPDNETTTLRYSMNKNAKVTIKIYDAGSNLVRILFEDIQQNAAEEQSVTWDGKNGDGDIVANGVYFFVIETSEAERAVGKIAILR